MANFDFIKRIEEQEKRLTEIKWFINQLTKPMILETYTIQAFGSEIKNNVFNDDIANNEQKQLLKHTEEFTRSTRPRDPELK